LGIKQLREKTNISPERIRSAGGERKKTVSKDLCFLPLKLTVEVYVTR
jgi:hypothetical protein